jgi:hypothetical protein
MAISFKRIAGAVRQDGKLVPLDDGESMPEPSEEPSPPPPSS